MRRYNHREHARHWSDDMRTFLMTLAIFTAVAIHAQPAAFQRGDSVRVRPSSAESRGAIALKIVAVPGDRIRVDSARIFVNDEPVTGFSPEFVGRVAQAPRAPDVLPAGHYYVMGERRSNEDISEYWGVHAAVSLERTQ
jgi:Signal peptidase, peptidase S26